MKSSQRTKAKFTFALLIVILLNLSLYLYGYYFFPSELSVFEGEKKNWSPIFNVEYESQNEQETSNENTPLNSTSSHINTLPKILDARLRLFGILPIKETSISIYPKMSLAPCGITAGVKMLTDGVMVVGFNDIETENGRQNPAKENGIKITDKIVAVNGESIYTIDELSEILDKNQGETIKFSVKRSEEVLNIELNPVKSLVDGKYKIGIWVRDSAAGIGTITFVDTATGIFGGLGHGICDADTGKIMSLGDGIIQKTFINDIKKGKAGQPGELRGVFDETGIVGRLFSNNEYGIYGTLTDELKDQFLGKEIPIALKDEVKTGQAYILCNIEGNEVEKFEIEILKINRSGNDYNRNLMLKITDQSLIEKSGGIVQGMSGSPIIQNGKIIGAVTHVLVSDPTKGYGIFIENMIKNVSEADVFSGGYYKPPLKNNKKTGINNT